METQELEKFGVFLQNYVKAGGKKLSPRTINGILTMAKFIPDLKENMIEADLKVALRDYFSTKNHPVAKHAVSLYLKWLGYDGDLVSKVAKIGQRLTAVRDQEKLAESVLSKKEVLRLFSDVKNERDNLIIQVLYDTAARISEVCNVKVSDVDFENKEIKLMGKGRKPRYTYFQKETAELLKTWIKKKRLKPDDLLFDIKPITVWYNLKRYGKEILNRDLRPHMFRHSRLQHMGDDGVDSLLIKAYAGHEDVRTTQIYVKASRYQSKLASEKAGDIREEKAEKSQKPA